MTSSTAIVHCQHKVEDLHSQSQFVALLFGMNVAVFGVLLLLQSQRGFGRCVLKTIAECDNICDEELVDAQFVAGVIISGNPVDFSCIADIPRIQVHEIHQECASVQIHTNTHT
jgi:hypothetical protein